MFQPAVVWASMCIAVSDIMMRNKVHTPHELQRTSECWNKHHEHLATFWQLQFINVGDFLILTIPACWWRQHCIHFLQCNWTYKTELELSFVYFYTFWKCFQQTQFVNYIQHTKPCRAIKSGTASSLGLEHSPWIEYVRQISFNTHLYAFSFVQMFTACSTRMFFVNFF